MRVGEVLSAEPVPKADKLLKLQVDIGTEVRQVCAGLAQYYKPEELVGMRVVLVVNLQPRKLRGVESNGMVACRFSRRRRAARAGHFQGRRAQGREAQIIESWIH